MTTTIERTPIEVDQFQIDYHHSLADRNASALQRVHEIFPITTEAEAREAVAGRDHLIRKMMEAHHKRFAGAFNVMELTMPQEIALFKNAFDNLAQSMEGRLNHVPGQSGFQFVKYDGNRWRVNTDQLEAYCERFVKYADPLKLEVAETIAEALNRLPDLSEGQKINLFSTPCTRYDPSTKKFVPEIKFIRQ